MYTNFIRGMHIYLNSWKLFINKNIILEIIPPTVELWPSVGFPQVSINIGNKYCCWRMRSLLGAHHNTPTIYVSVFPSPKGCLKEKGWFNLLRLKCAVNAVLRYHVNKIKGRINIRNSVTPTVPSPFSSYPTEPCLFTSYPKETYRWRYTHLNWISFISNILPAPGFG